METGPVSMPKRELLLTEKDFITINEWAATITADLETIRDDFKSKKFRIEFLDVRGRLTVEDRQKVIYMKAKFNINEERLLIVSKIT